MSVQVENLEEKNMARLTIEVPAEDLERELDRVYQKEKNSISIPGFRKGKVPRKVVEQMYGREIFYEDAANNLLQRTYGSAADESGVDIVSRPSVDIVQLQAGLPFIYTADVAVKPPVVLGQYTGVTVTAVPVTVSDEEVQQRLQREKEQNARLVPVTDRALASGDTAVIDFEGFMDGEPFEGGKGENYSLEIGSHSFVGDFEEQLIGQQIGETREIDVTFPKRYQEPTLAGKPAKFVVTLHEIKGKELPELDDDFAQDVSEFDTLDEYKQSLREELQKSKEEELSQAKQDEAVDKIIADSQMDIPEAMIDTQCENLIDEFADSLQQSGMTLEQYLKYAGQTMAEFREQVRPDAINRIQSSLVLEEIAKVEGLEITDEEFSEEVAKMAESYGSEPEDLLSYLNESDQNTMKNEMKIKKAVDFIMEHVEEVEPSAEPAKDPEAEQKASEESVEEDEAAEPAEG